jgi:signal transduction histidine kinase
VPHPGVGCNGHNTAGIRKAARAGINSLGGRAASCIEEFGHVMGLGRTALGRAWVGLFAALGVLCALSVPARAAAADPLVIGPAFAQEEVARHADIFIGQPGMKASTVEEVRIAPFEPSDGKLNFGFREVDVWLRVPIEVTVDRPEPVFLVFHYGSLDHLELTLEQPDGTTIHQVTGDRHAVSERPAKTHELAFRFVPQKGRSTAWVRVSTESALRLRSTIYAATEYVEAEAHERMILGIYAGFAILIVLYNLFVFFATGDFNFVRYCLLIGGYSAGDLAIRGLTAYYLYPDSPTFANVFIPDSMFPTMSAGLWFALRFLSPRQSSRGLEQEYPRVYKAGQIAMWALLFGPLTHALGSYHLAVTVATEAIPIWAIYLITIGALLARSGFRPAKFFLLAWTSFIIGVSIQSLMSRGHLPANAYTNYAGLVGASIQMVLLSFGLADRINFLQAEVARQEKLTLDATKLALEEQERMNVLKDEFLANTSHELRTPLNGIIGLADMLEEEPQFDDRAKANLRLIASSGRRLANLVNDILDFSKLKQNELVLQKAPTDIAPIAEAVVALARPQVGKKPVTITNEVPADLAPVYGDPNRIQQVLFNLVGNAVKFTEAGTVSVTAESTESEVRIHIVDSGIGISADALGRIFESFQQGDGSTARKYGGTGLGLAVTKQLVEAHGGQVLVESALGKGSRFTVVLPRSTAHDSVVAPAPAPRPVPAPSAAVSVARIALAAPKAPAAPPEVPASAPGVPAPPVAAPAAAPAERMKVDISKGRVLVVDDEPVNREVLLQLLTQRGYEVELAEDGIEGVAKIQGDALPDIVLLDVMMPGKSGYEVLDDVRKTLDKETLPILLLTAKTQEKDLAEGFKHGANDYVTKPFSRMELEARVQHHLTVSRQSRRLAAELAERVRLEGTNEELKLQHASARANLEAIAHEREALVAELDEAQKQLVQAEKMASLGQQVSGIAHEIGNPLNYISGSAQLMNLEIMDIEEKCADAGADEHFEKLREHLTDIETGCEKIREISQAMRNYSRLDDTATPGVDLVAVAHEALVILEGKARGITLNMEPKAVPAITCHRSHVGQVIMNLVGNAIDALQERRESEGVESCGRILVDLRALENNGAEGVEILVDDDGPGVPKHIRAKILEPFFTTKPAGKGTGLGLAITSKIVANHGGRITIDTSETLGGASFRVWLPLVPVHEGAEDSSGLHGMFDDE